MKARRGARGAPRSREAQNAQDQQFDRELIVSTSRQFELPRV